MRCENRAASARIPPVSFPSKIFRPFFSFPLFVAAPDDRGTGRRDNRETGWIEQINNDAANRAESPKRQREKGFPTFSSLSVGFRERIGFDSRDVAKIRRSGERREREKIKKGGKRGEKKPSTFRRGGRRSRSLCRVKLKFLYARRNFSGRFASCKNVTVPAICTP